MEDTIREWTLPAGSRVKINGLPFALRDEAVVRGAHSPDDFPVGEMSPNDPDQPPAAETPGEPAGPNRRSVASDGSAESGWSAKMAEEINSRFTPLFGWPEGFVSAKPTPDGGMKLYIGWGDLQVRKDGSSVGGGTDMGTHRMAGVVREAYKIVNPPPSDCSQSGCMPPGYQPEGPIPQFSDPPAADLCEQKRE